MLNNRYIDLHTHSSASDGTDAPERIAELASDLGLAAVALTDHDTVAGAAAFMESGKRFPDLETIAGVEISCSYSCREIHMVGLFVDPQSEDLNDFLRSQRLERLRRNEELRSKLGSLGFPLEPDEPEFRVPDPGNLGRPHFARALVRRYGFSSMAAVFDKLLGHSRPAFVPRRLPDPVRAIAAIHASGGIAVWAHPVYRDRGERSWLKRGLRRLKEWGLDGVEGYYSLFGPNETALVSELAALYDVALSGGSDYHGENASVALGVGAGGLKVPEALLAELKRRCDLLRRGI